MHNAFFLRKNVHSPEFLNTECSLYWYVHSKTNAAQLHPSKLTPFSGYIQTCENQIKNNLSLYTKSYVASYDCHCIHITYVQIGVGAIVLTNKISIALSDHDNAFVMTNINKRFITCISQKKKLTYCD